LESSNAKPTLTQRARDSPAVTSAPDLDAALDWARKHYHDVLIVDNTVHIPLGKPVKMVLRSKDVLHDFFVPEFRARMNLVPGLVTYFWFTPTKTGKYEILCAQLCGVGHYTMRGYVIVDDQRTFDAWLKKQPTYAQSVAAR
jgi:cytochrome c oxidase subunit 2